MINGVIAKNFQSWKDLKFQFMDGVTLIDGWNQDDQTAEGSGKSAILNAICWCLYGKLPKDAKVDDVIKSGEKSCEVRTLLNHHIVQEIVRSRKPNDLAIVDINQKVIKGKDARETQKMIEDLIGLSFETFCQTIYFPQNYPKKFVTANQEERGKILSEIQDLELFDRGRKEVMSLIKAENSKQISLKHDLDTNNLKLESNERAIQQQELFVQQKIQERDQRVQKYQFEIQNKQSQMDSINATIQQITNNASQLSAQSATWDNDLQEIDSQINMLQQEIAKQQNLINDQSARDNRKRQLQQDLNRYRYEKESLAKKRRELVEFIENPTEICPTCGTGLGVADTSHAQQELNKIESDLQEKGNYATQLEADLMSMENVTDVQAINANITSMSSAITQMKQVENTIRSNRQTLETSNTQIMNQQNMYQLHAREVEKYTKLIDDEMAIVIEVDRNIVGVLEEENRMLATTITQLTSLYSNSVKYLQDLEILKDGFKEVKSYTFNSVLNELTYKANNYLTQLFETPVDLKFVNDNMKIELEITINGHSRGYGLFSGGQSRRIGLAVDLALSEIIANRSGSKCVNLRFLDEYFKDLDENSMQRCLRLLEKLGGSTILIEHNSVFKSIVDNTVNVELSDETSRMVA